MVKIHHNQNYIYKEKLNKTHSLSKPQQQSKTITIKKEEKKRKASIYFELIKIIMLMLDESLPSSLLSGILETQYQNEQSNFHVFHL